MDNYYLQQLGNQAYAQCLKRVTHNIADGVNDEHETGLHQCVQNFIKSYQLVGWTWARFAASQPDMERLSPPKLDDE